jgi:hypothetical protein
MKKILPLLLLVLATPLFGQSCGSGLPSWMVCNTSTETLSVPHLALTGGVSYAAGDYIVTFDGNDNLTYTPYTPESGPAGPAGPAGPPGPAGASYSINGIAGGVTLAAGSNINLATSDNTITINSTATGTGSSGGSSVIGTTISVPSTTMAAYTEQTRTYTLNGLPAPDTPAVVYVNPSIDFGGDLRYGWRVTAANTVVVKITNVVNLAQTIPAYTLYISAVH